MGAKCFTGNGTIKTPLWEVSEDSATAKQRVLAVAHTTLTAKTPYKIIIDELGYKTMALTTEGYNCFIGVPESSVVSGEVGEFVIQGFIEDVITPSLSVAVGHAFFIDAEAVADKGADYTGVGTEFAICCTASTSATTQDMYLTGRMLNERIILDSSTNNTGGGVMALGSGTAEFAPAGTEIINDTADMKFVDMRFDCGATGGTARGVYIKLFLTGTTGGEALRAYTTCISNTPADTVNGAHISLGYGTTVGNCTGLATALRATVMVPARALTGTVTAVNAELFCTDTTSTSTGVISCVRLSIAGNATGITALTRYAGCVAFHFDAGCVDTTNGVVDHGHTTNTAAGSFKIYIDGVGLQWVTYGTGA